jgi:diguanylate cyclase (GGDEF)-like protein
MAANPYAGIDRQLAMRMAAAFLAVAVALALAVMPLAPPTRAIGAAGWFVVALTVVGSLGVVALLLRRRRVPYGVLLLTGYAGVAQIAVVQWLAGGLGAPYWQLLILPVLEIAAVHPARRVISFLVVTLAAAAAPLVYDSWSSEAAAAYLLAGLLWIGTSVITYRLMNELRIRRLEARREEDHAKQLARLDALTGLNNRRAFDEAIGEQVAVAHETGRPLSVLIADIDSFKRINDDHGHVNGDSCLRRVARTLQVSVRSTDSCFRWGGDEFAVLLPGADAALATELCERIETAVSVSCRAPDGGALTVSCGHTQLDAGMSERDLLEAADLAMLSLKRSAVR